MSNYFDTLRDVSRGITIKSKNSVDRSKVTVIDSNETNARKGIKNPVLSKKQQTEMILARHKLMDEYRLTDDKLENGMLVVLYRKNGYRSLGSDDEYICCGFVTKSELGTSIKWFTNKGMIVRGYKHKNGNLVPVKKYFSAFTLNYGNKDELELSDKQIKLILFRYNAFLDGK